MQTDASRTRLDESGDLRAIGDAEPRSAMATTVEDRADHRIAAGDRCRDPDRDLGMWRHLRELREGLDAHDRATTPRDRHRAARRVADRNDLATHRGELAGRRDIETIEPLGG